MTVPWLYDLRCGCTIQTVIDGISQVAMFDGISGLNVKCPTHGWTLAQPESVVSSDPSTPADGTSGPADCPSHSENRNV